MARRTKKRAVWRAQKRRQRRRTSGAVRAAARRLRERAEARLVEATALVRALRRKNPWFRWRDDPAAPRWEREADDGWTEADLRKHGTTGILRRTPKAPKHRPVEAGPPVFEHLYAKRGGFWVRKKNPLDLATLVTGAVTGAGAFAATRVLERAWKRRKARPRRRRCMTWEAA